MRERLESLLLALAVGSVVAIGAKRFAVPYNVALVVVGLLLVFVDVLPHQPMNPEVILVAFLPLLVFEGALFADADSLRRASRPILTLAVPGVFISLLGTAGVATFTLGLPFGVALLLGALLAITDTVSVLLAFRSVRVPHRLAAIMEGESLFNDGTALVLVSLATEIVVRGQFDAVHTVRDLLIEIVGGLAVGGAFAAIGSIVLRWTPDHLTAILVSIVLVLATSLIAERLHSSPVIAVVVAGLAVGRTARRTLEPSRVLAIQGFWETTGFGINVLLFLLVGMQIEAASLVTEAPSILIALLALHAGRAIAVYGSFGALRTITKEPVPLEWQHVMVVGNIKGALSMAAVLALPTDLPYRGRLVTIVFGVTFATLLLQALPFRKVLVMLGVSLASADEDLDRARARLIAARRAQIELDELLATGLVSRREHAERRANFQRTIIHAEGVIQRFRIEGLPDDAVDFAVLNAQKVSILDAARRGLIEGPAVEKEVAELDRSLVALASNEGDH
ncbi:MAG: sodium:proton antiporter [Polyangiaceae bacterium]